MKILYASYQPLESYRGDQPALYTAEERAPGGFLARLIDRVAAFFNRWISDLYLRNQLQEKTFIAIDEQINPSHFATSFYENFVLVKCNQEIVLLAHSEEGESIGDFIFAVQADLKGYFAKQTLSLRDRVEIISLADVVYSNDPCSGGYHATLYNITTIQRAFLSLKFKSIADSKHHQEGKYFLNNLFGLTSRHDKLLGELEKFLKKIWPKAPAKVEAGAL